MKNIPSTAKIPIVINGKSVSKDIVVTQYNKVFTLQTKSVESRGWIMDILNLVERMNESFSLNQIYSFADELKLKHPYNNHIKDKIRQQLQVLRDKGFLEFLGMAIIKKVEFSVNFQQYFVINY